MLLDVKEQKDRLQRLLLNQHISLKVRFFREIYSQHETGG